MLHKKRILTLGILFFLKRDVMKNLLLIGLLLQSLYAFGQEAPSPSRWQAQLSLGHYPASLVVPSFAALHPGIHAGLSYQWNKSPDKQLRQSAQLGYIFHRNFQHAVQAYTEVGYQFHFKNGLAITPLALGGGYVLSVPDLTSLEWDPGSQSYQEVGNTRHNWLISLGFSLSYETGLQLLPGRKTRFFLDYRLQVQGTIVQETVPLIAYSPLRLGISVPIGIQQ
jgi:hypothetical protein